MAATVNCPEGVRVPHYCKEHGVTVREAVMQMGIMTPEEADLMIDPMLMTEPARMAEAIARFKAMKAANNSGSFGPMFGKLRELQQLPEKIQSLQPN